MKKMMILLLAAALTLGGCARVQEPAPTQEPAAQPQQTAQPQETAQPQADAQPQEAAQPQADAQASDYTQALGASGQVAQVACSVQQADEGYLVYCFAQIFNNSDRVIALDAGTLEVVSGEQLLADQPVERIWPSFINPGEHGYVYDVVRIVGEDGQAVAAPQVTSLDYRLEYIGTDTAFANRRLDVQAQLTQTREDGPMTLVCDVTNATGADATEPTVTYGLFTDAGALVYAGGRTLDDIVIPDGQRIQVTFEVEPAFVEQWIAYGAKPTQAQVSAVYRGIED